METRFNPSDAMKNFGIIFLTIVILAVGCGKEEITGSGSAISESEQTEEPARDSEQRNSSIKLELGITTSKFKISESRMIESNIGHNFNNIADVNIELAPGESAELSDIQPNGIFALYLTSNEGEFVLSNTDGTGFSSKTVLLEKCSFIDLKVTNPYGQKIIIKGLLAGE